jgi:hypothetical protein
MTAYKRHLMQVLGLYVWVNAHRVILSIWERDARDQSWYFQDPECPAFLRKILGYPLGWNMADPETPALFRKNVGFELELWHLEVSNESY